MTVKGVITNIKTLLTAMEDNNHIKRIGTVWIGSFDTIPMPDIVNVTIQAITQNNTMSFPGKSPPSSPFSTPIDITVFVGGTDDTVTTDMYDLIDLIILELEKDLTFSGACKSAHFPPDGRVYYGDVVGQNQTGLVAMGQIKLIANFSS